MVRMQGAAGAQQPSSARALTANEATTTPMRNNLRVHCQTMLSPLFTMNEVMLGPPGGTFRGGVVRVK
jgi:hypothetical protein